MSASRPREQITPEEKRYARNITLVASSAMIIGGLNQSSINIVLPRMTTDLGASAAEAGWLLLSSMLVSNALMVVVGRLSDLTSRRWMFIAGTALFSLSNVAIGFAASAGLAVTARALSGLGNAMMFATTAALIGMAVPKSQIGKAMGIYMACGSAANLLGPVLGGVVAESIGWRWLFWINLPIGIIITWASHVAMKSEPIRRVQSFDVTGSLLLMGLLTALVATLQTISASGFGNPWIIVGIVVTVVLLPLFIWRERTAKGPLLELRLFRFRLFTGTTATSFLSNFSRFSLLTYVSLIYQSAYHLTPTQTGILVLPVAIGSLIAAPIAGYLEERFGSSWVSLVGTVIVVVSALMALTMIWRPHWYIVVGISMGLSGIGGSMVFTANSSAVTRASPSDQLGVISSVRIMIQGLGIITGAAAVLVCGTILLPPEGKVSIFAAYDEVLPKEYHDALIDAVPITLGLLIIAGLGSVFLSRIAYRGYREDFVLNVR